MAVPVRRGHAQLGEVVRGERGEAGGPAGRRGPAHQSEQLGPGVGSDRVRRVQVQDAAGDGVHVERPGPERAVTAAQGVELLHRHRVRLLVEGDDRLAAQLGPGDPGEGAGSGPVGGYPGHGPDDDREVVGGEAGRPGGQVPLEPVQFGRQQPGEAVPCGGGPPPSVRAAGRPVGPGGHGSVAGDLDAGQGGARPVVAQPGGGHLGGEHLQGPLPLRRGARRVPPVRHQGPGREGLRGSYGGGATGGAGEDPRGPPRDPHHRLHGLHR
ncbi:hypothetical protein I3W98_20785, partial [Streptomyces cavourensis]|nr:hypothetical protein [Streptomyces cavourensis]